MPVCPNVAQINGLISDFKKKLEQKKDNDNEKDIYTEYQNIVDRIGRRIRLCSKTINLPDKNTEELLQHYSDITYYDDSDVAKLALAGRRAMIEEFLKDEYNPENVVDTSDIINADKFFIMALQKRNPLDTPELIEHGKPILSNAIDEIKEFVDLYLTNDDSGYVNSTDNTNVSNGKNTQKGGARATNKKKCAWTSTGRKVNVKTPRGIVQKTVYKSTTGKLCVRKLSKRPDGTNKVSYVKF